MNGAPIINYARRVLEIKDVHDGDTFLFEVDQGVGDRRELWVRLHGIDTWELSQPLGKQARDFVANVLAQGRIIIIQTFKTNRDKDVTSFIRYVADVWVDDKPLAEIIRAAGYEKND